MTHRVSLLTASLALSVLACDAEPDSGAPSSANADFDAAAALQALDPADLPVLDSDVVARVDVGESEILFIAREAFPGEGDGPVIDIAEIGPPDAEIIVAPLLDLGATALEILTHLDPEQPAPQVMSVAHEDLARQQDRPSLAVRELSRFRDNSSVTHNAAICPQQGTFSFFLFNEAFASVTSSVRTVTTVLLNTSTPQNARTALIVSPESSGKNVIARVCNPESQAGHGCNYDRFDAWVVTTGPAGPATVFQGELRDCDVLHYAFGKRVKDQVYAVVVDNAQRLSAASWFDCFYSAPGQPSNCEYLNVMIGVGLKK